MSLFRHRGGGGGGLISPAAVDGGNAGGSLPSHLAYERKVERVEGRTREADGDAVSGS